MATVFVVPAEGLTVPNLDIGEGAFIAPAGETVELTPYIQRRIDDGDLIISEPAGPHRSDVVLSDVGSLSYDTITIVSGAGELLAGTVLGQLTSGGKWQPSPATGSDGSETAGAVLMVPVDATSGDVDAEAMTNFGEVRAEHLTYDATVNDNTKKAAKATQLRAAGVKVRS